MKQLRVRTLILVCWLAISYLITQYWEPINLANYTFIYALAAVIIILAIPQIHKINQLWLITIPTFVYLIIKKLLEGTILVDTLLITIVEMLLIVVTTMLLVWLLGAIREFENSVGELTINKKSVAVDSDIEGKSILYREVRRARNHQRPLTIIALSIDENSIKSNVNRLIIDAQQRVIRQFTYTRVSQTLCEKLEDCDTVVQTNDHFLIVLPETKPEDLPLLTERIRKQITSEVGVEIQIGTASLPQDGFTLEGLVEKATMEMRATSEPDLILESEQLLIKNKAS